MGLKGNDMDTVETLERQVNKVTKNPERKEGKVAKFIENQTAKVPSDVYLWAAVTSMAASLTFKIMRRDDLALFIGQWAPSLLVIGVYNKLVKQLGNA